MIYSNETEKKCAVCVFAEIRGEDIYCAKKKQTLSAVDNACAKFSYDILKRRVRRAKRLKTDFNPEDFTL